MRPDLLLEHAALHGMTRRETVALALKAGAAGTLAGVGLGAPSVAGADMKPGDRGRKRFSDEMFNVEAVLRGA
jgi:hypothetical protein